MKRKEKYLPIDCSFHDELLDRCVRSTKVPISYFDLNENRVKVVERIIDVYTQEGEEFLITESGLEIRLDHLISVDGKPLPK